MARSKRIEPATRAAVVTLKVLKFSSRQIFSLTHVCESTQRSIWDKALDRGFDPSQCRILDKHVADGARSGRPKKDTKEVREALLKKIRRDRYGREKTSLRLSMELKEEGIEISGSTVYRILKRINMRKTKPTRKPGLTQKMKDERLAWCLEHENWTLEDWKRVIWTDETSVVVGHRRGSFRVWRTPEERVVKSVIRERFKGYSDFMWWSCFTYDNKGPYHIWKPETAAQKKKAQEVIDALNEELEPAAKAEWS